MKPSQSIRRRQPDQMARRGFDPVDHQASRRQRQSKSRSNPIGVSSQPSLTWIGLMPALPRVSDYPDIIAGLPGRGKGHLA